jgi:TolA-binding protein
VNSKFRTLVMLSPLVLALLTAAPAAAQPSSGSSQSSVTSSDIQRLQDQVYDTGNEISRMRGRDAALADQLQNQLDDLRDEVTYLKVRMRREGSVSRADYDDVRRRVQDVRSQARGQSSGRQNDSGRQGDSTWGTNSGRPSGGYGSGSGSGSGGYSGGTNDQQDRPSASSRPGEVPAGQQLDVRLERELSSETAQVEDRFSATTVVDLYQGNEVLVPAGSTLRGVVSSVTNATRTQRKGSLTVAFDQITVRGRSYPIHGTVEQALESEGIRGEAGKIGAGAGVGAILGGILGGAKGALLGILIGGGGTIAATEGKDVVLPAGTVLRVRLDQPLMVK